ncbi:MAG: PEGA domain-containing protein, partial [Myxococcales bacterium]|nr:PEGA domain-containing protein [Myxococcales bacterium]
MTALHSFAGVLAVAVAIVASPALAQDTSAPDKEVSAADKETARQLLDEGDAARSAGRLEEALKKYEAADAIMGVPTTSVEVGKALEALGRFVEARDAYLRTVRYDVRGDNAPFRDAQAEADRRAHAVVARIATLEVTLKGPAEDDVLTVLIDGVEVPRAGIGRRAIDPGEHEVVVRGEGYAEARRKISLGEGETVPVELTLERQATPTPPPKEGEASRGFPIWATVGFSVAAVGVGLGTAMGILSLGKAGELEDQCPDSLCRDPSLEDTQ